MNNDFHEVGVGNWMESLVGSCSALMHMGATLPQDSFIVILPSETRGMYFLRAMGTESWNARVMICFDRLVRALQEAGFRL